MIYIFFLVLSDIIEVLFNEQLIKELEDAPQLGRHTHIKQLMEDIASVSVMRLDSFSMNKLWELMIMVFKWQLTNIKPNELFVLTDRHLSGILELLPGHPVLSKVEAFRSKIYTAGAQIPEERIVFMRNLLVSWLNDFHTKVSLLLRLGLQRSDGSFIIINNPDENIAKILLSLGSNIYSYENAENEEEKFLNADVSEVSFLSQDFLGEGLKNNIKASGFKHYFLQKSSKSANVKSEVATSSSCKFEMEDSKRGVSKMDDLQFDCESQIDLHQDLLAILSDELKE